MANDKIFEAKVVSGYAGTSPLTSGVNVPQDVHVLHAAIDHDTKYVIESEDGGMWLTTHDFSKAIQVNFNPYTGERAKREIGKFKEESFNTEPSRMHRYGQEPRKRYITDLPDPNNVIPR